MEKYIRQKKCKGCRRRRRLTMFNDSTKKPGQKKELCVYCEPKISMNMIKDSSEYKHEHKYMCEAWPDLIYFC